MKKLVLPLLLVVSGVAWLLSDYAPVEGVSWFLVLGLAYAGTAVLLVSGIDKFSIVTGPFLLIAAVLAWGAPVWGLETNVVAPMLLVVLGLLAMLAQLLPLPAPKWSSPGQLPEDAPNRTPHAGSR